MSISNRFQMFQRTHSLYLQEFFTELWSLPSKCQELNTQWYRIYFLQVSPSKSYTHLSSLPYVLCAPPISCLNLIIWMIFGDEYTSLSSLLCSLLQSPVTSSLLGPNILLSTVLEHPQPTFLLHVQPNFTSIQNKRQNYISVYLNIHIFG